VDKFTQKRNSSSHQLFNVRQLHFQRQFGRGKHVKTSERNQNKRKENEKTEKSFRRIKEVNCYSTSFLKPQTPLALLANIVLVTLTRVGYRFVLAYLKWN
jgi:hypothetical protein